MDDEFMPALKKHIQRVRDMYVVGLSACIMHSSIERVVKHIQPHNQYV